MIIVYLLIALLALGGGSMIIQNNRIPAAIGVHDGRLAPVPKSPNAVSSQTDDPDKRVDPLPLAGNGTAAEAGFDAGEASLDLLETIVHRQGASIISRSPGYLHAVYVSAGMKFKDDVEFLVDAEAELVHFRSASRVGYGDMGVNRARYLELRRAYEQELAGQ